MRDAQGEEESEALSRMWQLWNIQWLLQVAMISWNNAQSKDLRNQVKLFANGGRHVPESTKSPFFTNLTHHEKDNMSERVSRLMLHTTLWANISFPGIPKQN